MFLINNSPALYALQSEKKNLFLAGLPRILANSDKNYGRFTTRLLPIFPKISGDIKFRENLQR